MTKVRGKSRTLDGDRTVFLSNRRKDGKRAMRFETPGQEPVWLFLSQEALDALCDLNERRTWIPDPDPVLGMLLDWMDGTRRRRNAKWVETP